jgi:osmotically-inducible protein OsmY
MFCLDRAEEQDVLTAILETTMKSQTDEQIHHDVLHELELDDRVTQTEVGVQVDDGIVTLTGIVSSFSKKLAACAAAHRTRNVRYVANNLQVRDLGCTGISDTTVASGVRCALRRLRLDLDRPLHITVAHGMVTVSGTVPTVTERAMVIAAIREVDGALVIVNRVEFESSVDSATPPIRFNKLLPRHQPGLVSSVQR